MTAIRRFGIWGALAIAGACLALLVGAQNAHTLPDPICKSDPVLGVDNCLAADFYAADPTLCVSPDRPDTAGYLRNTGIAFDGQNLLITCWRDNTIVVVTPVNTPQGVGCPATPVSGYPWKVPLPYDPKPGCAGSVVRTVQVQLPATPALYSTPSRLGAAAWDKGRKKLWVCANDKDIRLVDMTDGSSTHLLDAPGGCRTGLAYDRTDDSIWFAGDTAYDIYHYAVAGASGKPELLVRGDIRNSESLLLGGMGVAGIATGGKDLFLSSAAESRVEFIPKTFDGVTFFARFELLALVDMECDEITFQGRNPPASVIWVQIERARELRAYIIPKGKCGYGGGDPTPPPAPPVVETPPPTTVPAPVTTTRPPTTTVPKTTVKKKKKRKAKLSCASVRRFTIHIFSRGGVSYRSAVVTVAGRKQKVKRGKSNPSKAWSGWTALIDLRGKPRRTFTVKITVKTTAGATLTGTRVYHPCIKFKKPTKTLFL